MCCRTKREVRIKHFCCTYRVTATSRKALCGGLCWELKELLFSWKTIFTGRFDWQTGCSDLAIWPAFFWKMTGMSLSLQGKQLLVFVTNDQIKTFKWKLELCETLFITVSLTSSQYLKTFLGRKVAIFMNWFVDIVEWNLSTFGRSP